MENQKKIIIVAKTKTKTGKSILDYLVPTIGKSTNRVGYLIAQDWRDNDSWFNEITDDMIGKTVLVEVEYTRMKNNHLVEKITKIIRVER